MSEKKTLITQSLFKLMSENEYCKITMSDIAKNAGIGRATLYRYFKSKEEIVRFYCEQSMGEFVQTQICPHNKDDYTKFITHILTVFKQNKDLFKLIRQARKEHIYLDFLNKIFVDSSFSTNEYTS